MDFVLTNGGLGTAACMLVPSYLSVIRQLWGLRRGGAARQAGGEWVGGKAAGLRGSTRYVRHVTVTAEVLVAGVGRAGHLTVAPDTGPTASGKAVVEAATARTTPEG